MPGEFETSKSKAEDQGAQPAKSKLQEKSELQTLEKSGGSLEEALLSQLIEAPFEKATLSNKSIDNKPSESKQNPDVASSFSLEQAVVDLVEHIESTIISPEQLHQTPSEEKVFPQADVPPDTETEEKEALSQSEQVVKVSLDQIGLEDSGEHVEATLVTVEGQDESKEQTQILVIHSTLTPEVGSEKEEEEDEKTGEAQEQEPDAELKPEEQVKVQEILHDIQGQDQDQGQEQNQSQNSSPNQPETKDQNETKPENEAPVSVRTRSDSDSSKVSTLVDNDETYSQPNSPAKFEYESNVESLPNREVSNSVTSTENSLKSRESVPENLIAAHSEHAADSYEQEDSAQHEQEELVTEEHVLVEESKPIFENKNLSPTSDEALVGGAEASDYDYGTEGAAHEELKIPIQQELFSESETPDEFHEQIQVRLEEAVLYQPNNEVFKEPDNQEPEVLLHTFEHESGVSGSSEYTTSTETSNDLSSAVSGESHVALGLVTETILEDTVHFQEQPVNTYAIGQEKPEEQALFQTEDQTVAEVLPVYQDHQELVKSDQEGPHEGEEQLDHDPKLAQADYELASVAVESTEEEVHVNDAGISWEHVEGPDQSNIEQKPESEEIIAQTYAQFGSLGSKESDVKPEELPQFGVDLSYFTTGQPTQGKQDLKKVEETLEGISGSTPAASGAQEAQFHEHTSLFPDAETNVSGESSESKTSTESGCSDGESSLESASEVSNVPIAVAHVANEEQMVHMEAGGETGLQQFQGLEDEEPLATSPEHTADESQLPQLTPIFEADHESTQPASPEKQKDFVASRPTSSVKNKQEPSSSESMESFPPLESALIREITIVATKIESHEVGADAEAKAISEQHDEVVGESAEAGTFQEQHHKIVGEGTGAGTVLDQLLKEDETPQGWSESRQTLVAEQVAFEEDQQMEKPTKVPIETEVVQTVPKSKPGSAISHENNEIQQALVALTLAETSQEDQGFSGHGESTIEGRPDQVASPEVSLEPSTTGQQSKLEIGDQNRNYDYIRDFDEPSEDRTSPVFRGVQKTKNETQEEHYAPRPPSVSHESPRPGSERFRPTSSRRSSLRPRTPITAAATVDEIQKPSSKDSIKEAQFGDGSEPAQISNESGQGVGSGEASAAITARKKEANNEQAMSNLDVVHSMGGKYQEGINGAASREKGVTIVDKGTEEDEVEERAAITKQVRLPQVAQSGNLTGRSTARTTQPSYSSKSSKNTKSLKPIWAYNVYPGMRYTAVGVCDPVDALRMEALSKKPDYRRDVSSKGPHKPKPLAKRGSVWLALGKDTY